VKLIDINTTQNVTIQYELASLKERIFAYVADMIILGTALFFIAMFAGIAAAGGNAENVIYIVAFPIFFFYTLVVEYLMNGQSPGKKLQKLKIIKLNGKQPELNDYIIRWAFRSLDIYFSSGALASILIGSSNKAQRLGDVLAGTVVVKIKASHDFKIEDLLKIQKLDDYQVTYPMVKNLKEDDLLMIKTVMDRYKSFPNNGHREALFSLSKKIGDRLEISDIPQNRVNFLNTLIRDYVMLTR